MSDEVSAGLTAVSKEDYLAWEGEVVAAFYDATKRFTQLVPTDGTVAVLRLHLLVVLVVHQQTLYGPKVKS